MKLPFVKQFISGKTFVLAVVFIAFFGSQVIVNNASSLKFYKADQFVNLIQTDSSHPVIVGTETTVTSQPMVIGIELMSVGWEFKRQLDANIAVARSLQMPQFVIAESNAATGLESQTQLVQSLLSVSRPFDLWLLDMSPDLADADCTHFKAGNKGSFSYVHYVCNPP